MNFKINSNEIEQCTICMEHNAGWTFGCCSMKYCISCSEVIGSQQKCAQCRRDICCSDLRLIGYEYPDDYKLSSVISHLSKMERDISNLRDECHDLRNDVWQSQNRAKFWKEKNELLNKVLSDYQQCLNDYANAETINQKLKNERDNLIKDYNDKLNQNNALKQLLEKEKNDYIFNSESSEQLRKVRNSFFAYISFCWSTDSYGYKKNTN